jgi:competence protein ComEC
MIAKVSLFSSRRDFFLFLLTCGSILFYSLLIQYQNYQKLTRFDSQILQATVIKQYEKITDSKAVQVLKLKSEDGLIFYTTLKNFPFSVKGQKLELEVWSGRISFYEYLTSFYAYSKVLHIYKTSTLKERFNSYIAKKHENQEIANIYQALFTAAPLSKELQASFSTLGVSHLLAISGFHLGVLSALLFFLIKPVYSFTQDRYFPYRNSKLDIFLIMAAVLLAYLLFLDSPASLLRSFAMLIIGFVIYDRGIKIVSMQTLFLSVLLLLSFFPKLVFALGFWLSVSGVFYIFLFLIHFKDLSKLWQFILLPFFVYILMLPFSLAIFGSFSIYHPLSIVWTTLFTLFYPLGIFLHVIGFGNLFDSLLESFIALGQNIRHVELNFGILGVHVILSLVSVFEKKFTYLTLIFGISVLTYAMYHVTQF